MTYEATTMTARWDWWNQTTDEINADMTEVMASIQRASRTHRPPPVFSRLCPDGVTRTELECRLISAGLDVLDAFLRWGVR